MPNKFHLCCFISSYFHTSNSILRNDGEIGGMGRIEGIGGIEGMEG